LNTTAAPHAAAVSRDQPLAFVQGLRGIAAMLVVMWHGSRFISPYGTGLGFLIFGSGRTMGVDLFFVISGFIMVYTTARNDGSIGYCRDYFVKRLTRIWPTYVGITVFYHLVASGLAYFYFSSSVDIRRFIETLTFVPLANTAGVPVIDYPALPVGWTLNYEMYFYVVFGVSLLFGRYRWLAFFGWMAASLIALPSAIGSVTLATTTNYGFRFPYVNLMTSPIIWLFVTGVVIGLAHQAGLTIRNKFYARLALAASTSLVVWQYASGFHTEHGILECGLSIIPFMLVLVLTSRTMSLPVPRFVVYLGDISFSLYLIHPLAQEHLEVRFDAAALNAYTSGPAFLFLTTALAVALAAVSHRYLERGLADWLKNRFLSGARRPASTYRDVGPIATS
jgi:peptidoglycan/LPS O-acetylase OafA/YrhL